ncbi:Topoisomerase 1-associated factor 1 [Claviceps sp. LM454 group G7]|nr:Topoisomerase 1-associated factor 1 [Claviceps sp. LM454 group G7]
MELADRAGVTVHPEVRAHISSLISALGGVSTEDDGQYQLGDDALEVLRDLKRWIRFYDEKTNRMDVARCIHHGNLIEGDLLPILKTWPENAMDNKFRSRIALACFELMVPLTWPFERDKERMTMNHHRHLPVLELAQVQYKRAIINFDGARILHAAVRAALPAMALPIGDRTARDQGIIKLVLFFLRNMAAIAPPPDVKYDGDETQISRSATIDAFSYQDIFHVLLTLASNMGEDFRTEDTAVMEIIYHLVKRVETDKLFMDDRQLNQVKASELSAMMSKEAAMLKSHNRKGPTRHNRFGTMIWVPRDDGKMSSLSGQDALTDAATRLKKMDDNKTFKPPRKAQKGNEKERDLGLPPKLNPRASDQLRKFVEDFIDSGFNPLFVHIRKTIDREAPHLLAYHRRQYFYLVAWFLEAQRIGRKVKKSRGSHEVESADVNRFHLVAGVLNQEMFITLNRALHESYETKDWTELTSVMRCLTQILLTVQDMTETGNEDDQEIAENVLSRLFYEESTHDAIAKIIRTYKDQGFDYLDAATELVHHFIRILEAFSKQNVDMQIRSKKRTRRKKKKKNTEKQQQSTIEGDDGGLDEEELDDSADDEKAAERTSKERKFDFHRFSSRFTPQAVVDTFTTFTKFYRDLTDEQLKRAHRYFYRVAFKEHMSVMLFRVDIINLFYNMVKGPESLDRGSSSMYREWEDLVKHLLRRCTKKIQERPELLVEMLFSKVPATAFFLEYGYERQTTVKNHPKPAAELVFKHTEERDQQIAIAVGALLDNNGAEHISWVKQKLSEAESNRRAWSAAEEAKSDDEAVSPSDKEPAQEVEGANTSAPLFNVRRDSLEQRTAVFKNAHLRLLMKLSDMRLMGPASDETPESVWIIPGDVSADTLKDTLHFINQAEFNPPTFEDGSLAEKQLKRKVAPRKKAVFDDDGDDGAHDDAFLDDDLLFPAGGPTARNVIDETQKKKTKNPRKRRKAGDTEEPTDAELNEKARKRREKELEKARRIKSALYVRDGDDEFDSEEDEAFFAREREIAARAKQAAATAGVDTYTSAAKNKRKSTVLSDDSEDDNDEDEADDESTSSTRKRISSSQGAGDSETEDMPVDMASDGESRKRIKMGSVARDERDSSVNAHMNMDLDADMDVVVDMDVNMDADVDMDSAPAEFSTAPHEDEEPQAEVVTRRSRVRGGFVLDSDDE